MSKSDSNNGGRAGAASNPDRPRSTDEPPTVHRRTAALPTADRRTEKPVLTLVFRDKRAANHSIERLFAALEPYFAEEFEIRKVVVPRQPSGLRALWANIRHARKHARGIVHVTGDAQYLVPFLPRGRTVLTIHDCGYLMKLRGLKRILYKWIWFKCPCRTAARITVISESTRTVLEREVGAMGQKLVIVENCLTRGLQHTARPFDAACPRILQIGSGRHKNLDTLIKAVDGLDCEIRVVGRLSDENRGELKRRGIKYVNEFGVSDERLEEIYRECDILFFASRHEGFGLPILEGQMVGIPVVTSTVYSMPHVAGDGAILVDPEDSDGIRAAIRLLFGAEVERSRLVAEGFRNIERFSPQKVAQGYIHLYRELL